MRAHEYGPPFLTEAERRYYKSDPYALWEWAAEHNACVACAARDGKQYTLNEIPGRPHPNCKCRLVLVRTMATVPHEDRWYPDFGARIHADCTMGVTGEIANFVQLLCYVSTPCIPMPTKRVSPTIYSGKRHKGVYEAFLVGPGVTPENLFFSVTHFSVEIEVSGDHTRFTTPLHALEGWANVFTAGLVAGLRGSSISRFELGATATISIGEQTLFDASIGWYGGHGSLKKVVNIDCELSQ